MFKEKVEKGTSLLFNLAWKYFCIKLGLTLEEMELINISTVKRLGPGTQGNCGAIYILGDLKRIHIKIVRTSDLGMIDVMAHELVHARQNLRGEFSFQKVLKHKWFGLWPYTETHRFHKDQNLEETPYWEQLCEQEAYMASREMVRQFLNFMYHLENNVEFVAEQKEEGRLYQVLDNSAKTQDDSIQNGREMPDDSTRICPLVLARGLASSRHI
jgi:hypothetical protein